MLLNVNKKSNFNMANEVNGQSSSSSITLPMDFGNGGSVDLKVLQSSGNIFVKACDSELMETAVKIYAEGVKADSLSSKTLQLQFFWRKKYQSRDEIKKIHHERVFKNVLPIMSEIIESSHINVDKDRIFKKIVLFIIMFSGLGSPTQESIVKEAEAALHSIFKATEIENFLSFSKAAKEYQLLEFARLITGILLFNKDCKKGGEGMDDLPLILTEGVRATKDRLFSFKDKLDQRIEQLINPLLHCYKRKESRRVKERSDSAESKISLPQSFQKEKVEELKALLIYFRQIEFWLNDLIRDLEKSLETVEELVERLQASLLQVHNVVRYRVAVATVQVFPLFSKLSDTWVEMQEEVYILSEINNNFMTLSLSANSNLSTGLELPLIKEPTVPFETEEIRQLSDFHPGVKVCSILSVSQQEPLQYKGFCAWTLGHTEGVLITGNIALGILQFCNRFYTFSSAEAAYKWALNPNNYIMTVLKVARVKPELIKFLHLEEDLLKKLEVEEERKPTVANVEVQTELHPEENHVDLNYTFSEWEIKRKALKLANLTRCVTKSQQTVNLSCFRTEVATQVTPSKNISTQTVKDGFCNHPVAPRFAYTFRTKCPEFLEPHSK